jgi:hypothetical protein
MFGHSIIVRFHTFAGSRYSSSASGPQGGTSFFIQHPENGLIVFYKHLSKQLLEIPLVPIGAVSRV